MFGYELSDILLFSREVYLALIEGYNEDLWPLHGVFLLAIAALLHASWKRAPRVAFSLLAALWLWSGLVFQQRYFQTINWSAASLAWLFTFGAAQLFVLGVLTKALRFREESEERRRWGLLLLAFSFVVPFELLLGATAKQITYVGMGPTPVALGTLGFLIELRKSRWRLLVGATATLWLLYSGVMYYGLLTLD